MSDERRGLDRTAGGDIAVREARDGELPSVLNVLDGAALATDAERIAKGIERGDVLVAVAGDDGTDSRVVGALVLDGREITAVAVRRRRRGQGIGTRLVGAAADRRERLVATFDEGVRPFYETLGFVIEPVDSEEGEGEAGSGERYRGRLDVDGFDRV